MISGLHFWEDTEVRSAAEQMAMDEALLHGNRCPVVRFYRWTAPAMTFGYAQRYADVWAGAGGLPAIRRWTGGGTVFHGEDLTVALAVPASDGLCRMQTAAIYQRIHEALLGVVGETFSGARLARPDDCRPGLACFQSPALNDILHGGKKICGGALRRGRNGLLYQGSLHGNFSALSLGQALCSSVVIFEPDQEIFLPCVRLTKEKYGTVGWNQMR
ncbi:MAG: hypothetical protein WCO94_00895 [Verrucomicrobiota bacterium]